MFSRAPLAGAAHPIAARARAANLASALVVAAGLAAATPAWADIAPPRRNACHDKKVGDACSYGSGAPGACAVRLCTGKDGMPFDCVECALPGEETTTRPRPEASGFAAPLFSPADVAASSTPSAAPSGQAAPAGSAPAQGPAPIGGGCGRCAVTTHDATSPGVGLATTALLVAAAARRARKRARR